MTEQYGFYNEEYDNGTSIETLMTGDGKSQFTDIQYEEGKAAIGISYGIGEGIGTKTTHNKVLDESMLVKWQVKFESQQSVDAMIETLLRVKNHLAANNT